MNNESTGDNPMRTIIIALVIAACSANLHAATINPTSQKRSVQYSGDTGSGVTNLLIKAADFGVFDQSISYLIGRLDRVYMDASQQSVIGDTSITATGHVDVGIGIGTFSNLRAASDFKVTFKLVQPVTYVLSASLLWDATYGYSVVATSPVVRLTGPAGVILDANVPGDATPYDFSATGTLAAGTYTLEAHGYSATDFAGLDLQDYAVSLDLTPIGPPPATTKSVYQLTGSLNGRAVADGTAVTLTAPQIVNLSLGQSLTNVPKNQVLALVVDCLGVELPRLIVWNKSLKTVALEITSLATAAEAGNVSPYWAIATLTLPELGRFVGADSELTMVAKTSANNLCATNVVINPAIGQIRFVDDSGGTNGVLVTGGILRTGTKLGGLP
jgi:hypothetical protein